MAIVAVGIDLAKNVFAVHGVDIAGKRQLARRSNVERLSQLALPANSCQLTCSQKMDVELPN